MAETLLDVGATALLQPDLCQDSLRTWAGINYSLTLPAGQAGAQTHRELHLERVKRS